MIALLVLLACEVQMATCHGSMTRVGGVGGYDLVTCGTNGIATPIVVNGEQWVQCSCPPPSPEARSPGDPMERR